MTAQLETGTAEQDPEELEIELSLGPVGTPLVEGLPDQGPLLELPERAIIEQSSAAISKPRSDR
jgi:hypothetical protein